MGRVGLQGILGPGPSGGHLYFGGPILGDIENYRGEGRGGLWQWPSGQEGCGRGGHRCGGHAEWGHPGRGPLMEPLLPWPLTSPCRGEPELSGHHTARADLKQPRRHQPPLQAARDAVTPRGQGDPTGARDPTQCRAHCPKGPIVAVPKAELWEVENERSPRPHAWLRQNCRGEAVTREAFVPPAMAPLHGSESVPPWPAVQAEAGPDQTAEWHQKDTSAQGLALGTPVYLTSTPPRGATGQSSSPLLFSGAT